VAHRKPSRRNHLLLALLAALLCASPVPAADGGSPDEMKARFVFQLLRYVTWPESPGALGNASFVVGVVSDEGFASTLEKVIGGKQAQGRAVEVRRLSDDSDVSGVHLLFARGADPSSLRKLARDHHGQAVLTVADRFEFPDLGGDVGLELVGERVSFSISRRKSVRGDFVISSKLLRLASEVK
jgi:hypothetical protein